MIRFETPEEIADFRSSTERDIKATGESEIWLARISLDYKPEKAVEELADDLDRLFNAFQAEQTQWKQNYIGAIDTDWGTPAYSYDALNKLPADKRFGLWLTEIMDGLLDVEGEEEGSVTANWFFWLGASHILDIRAEGQHWTSRFYKNPHDGQLEDMDRTKLYELEQEFGVELEEHSNEVGYVINFEAVITEAPRSSDL